MSNNITNKELYDAITNLSNRIDAKIDHMFELKAVEHGKIYERINEVQKDVENMKGFDRAINFAASAVISILINILKPFRG